MAVEVQQISHVTVCHIAISLHAKLLLILMATTYMQLKTGLRSFGVFHSADW